MPVAGGPQSPTPSEPQLLQRDSPFAYHCAACSRCCHNYRIKVNPYEAWRIARHLGLTTTAFAQQYLADGPMLRRRDDGACVFLGDRGCRIHRDRPLVCRLYPLGRRVDADGSERFHRMTPHPQSEGSYEGPGCVDDYLQSQGTAPFVVAVDRYHAVFHRLQRALEARLVGDDALRARARAVGERQIDDVPTGLLDPDPMIEAHCRARGLPMPSDPEQAMTLHIAAIEAWLEDDSSQEHEP